MVQEVHVTTIFGVKVFILDHMFQKLKTNSSSVPCYIAPDRLVCPALDI